VHLAVDVDYRADGSAVAAGVAFAGWGAERPERVVLRTLDHVAAYRPGSFFERELPCILAVLEEFVQQPDTVVIDGYVTLGEERRDGLGAHLHRALGGHVPVIGVAKTEFRGTPAEAEVLRGASSRPLFVTSIGVEPAQARMHIRAMHGRNRLPTMLALADRACRAAA
jgi:deoxyribonuclease V